MLGLAALRRVSDQSYRFPSTNRTSVPIIRFTVAVNECSNSRTYPKARATSKHDARLRRAKERQVETCGQSAVCSGRGTWGGWNGLGVACWVWGGELKNVNTSLTPRGPNGPRNDRTSLTPHPHTHHKTPTAQRAPRALLTLHPAL